MTPIYLKKQKPHLQFLTLVMLLLFAFKANAQCPSGGIVLTSQSLVDQFIVNYPTCTNINGGVYIFGSGITSLQGLKNITSITGYLSILSTSVPNLDDLSGLTSIGGHLYLYNNSLLTKYRRTEQYHGYHKSTLSGWQSAPCQY